eukprot:TRINITY_DN36488_c0_g1_i1.p1 TRINITY_DN36488_c0_g1~~TRINITY_DN36488_c0_g1_i1.p1  ORF type:complete len:140 (+),score=20.01 TRINITY_DN36488_c0_g1_i1:98-517(+)
MENLITKATKVSVSSVKDRQTKEFGKKKMLDDDETTCWSSHHGSPQWFEVTFPSLVKLSKIGLQFQGGFVGQNAVVEVTTPDSPEKVDAGCVYPEDSNGMQVFDIEKPEVTASVATVRVTFPSSTDFYGRVTIYRLQAF